MNGWMIAGSVFLFASIILLWCALTAGSNADETAGYD